MELRLLGAVEAREGADVVPLGPRQRRLVLAVLAWEVNRMVPLDRLVDLIWPDAPPPATATHAVRVCVSQLRSLLAGNGDLELLTEGPGYLLRADPQLIDVHRFRALTAQARETGEDQPRVELLDEALSLWRGPALAGTASWLTRERLCSGVEEVRLLAVEDRLDALLRLGRHHEIIDELTSLVDTHPTRERLVGQLLLALYRGGRAGRALEVSRRIRAHLANELGIDPGAELQRLEQAILRNDAELDIPRPVPPRPVPAMLPPAVAGFTGRAETLARLDAAAAHPLSAVVIAGTAGVGKTALAVFWAHRVRDRFPDGQLYVNLRGYDPDPPLAPEQALFGFLRALGVPPPDVPPDQAEAAGLYRSILADKRMLVLLDNASGAEQVRSLLPAGPGCVVVVTSRNRLDGLVAIDAARRVPLDVLSEREAIVLLGRMIGADRVGAEPEAVAELARTCACLPLALRIAAAQVVGQPGRIEDYVARLRDDDLLAALAVDGDTQTAVRAAFGLSYAGLAPDAQRAFRLLGVLPGPDLSVVSTAALTGLPAGGAARVLDQLVVAHLVEQRTPGRYTLHDLLRRYAVECALELESVDERTAALTRLVAHYLGYADAAAVLLYPYMLRLPVVGAEPPVTGFTDHPAALSWLDTERANLVAAVGHAPRPFGWLLADTLRGYFYLRRDFPDWLATANIALAAASGEPRVEAALQFGLALADYARNRYEEASARYLNVLELSRDSGWVLGQAAAHTNLGLIDESQGDLRRAGFRYTEALALFREVDAPHSVAIALVNLGCVLEHSGELDSAAAHYAEALAMHRELGGRHGEADAHYYLGSVAWQRGELVDATKHVTTARDMYREIGARNDEAQALALLSQVHYDAEEYAEALDDAHSAVALAGETSDQRTEAAGRGALGAALSAHGEHRQALDHFERALDQAQEIDAQVEEIQIRLGTAATWLRFGDSVQAVEHAGPALALARQTGYRVLEGLALTALAEGWSAAGGTAEAVRHAREALVVHCETGHLFGEQRTLAVLATSTAGIARD
ncbi:MAG: putative regulatory protein [Amycolatopsis sp.]|uniref:AfsR/SARP family transcriptional regulator n=1 Tax=Amycolatopsis sp. TaxID=37632 RepID=UPI0026143463|nr:BTAD domain-containing putative transcriptional regulator [Amycolatopsis sp.]MCU1687535.1 putative regulatory protein [Amycolatopsis sp.]